MTVHTMQAAYCTSYGNPEVIKLQLVNKPTPKSTEVLVKIRASSVTRADSLMRQGIPKFSRLFLGFKRPKYPVLGTGFSGEIIEIGKEVTLFKVGDFVFGEALLGAGTNTEYVSISESKLIQKKPTSVSFKKAATICDGPLTSYSFLKDIGQLEKGQRILINGASGSLGTAAVQIAKHMGAYVVGVCSSKNTTLVKHLGADEVIDYKTSDFTTLDHRFDVIYDAVGKSSYKACKSILNKHGKYLSPVLSMSLLWHSLMSNICYNKKAIFSATGIRPPEALSPLVRDLKEMLDNGALDIIIDRTYPLHEIVQAHEYVDTGRKKGNVVILMKE